VTNGQEKISSKLRRKDNNNDISNAGILKYSL